MVSNENHNEKQKLSAWVKSILNKANNRYSSHLYSESAESVLKAKHIPATYNDDAKMEDGRIILRENFKKQLEKVPELLIFGEDAGKIGGVNQSLEGLQEQFGEERVFDTGIRECTIIGQGIGMAMR